MDPSITLAPPRAESGRASGWSATARPALWIWDRAPLIPMVLAFALYLTPASGILQLGPDQVEYLDVGRRLADGEGFLLGVKAFHIGGTEVLHNGLAERPPLLPFLIAGLLIVGLDFTAIQVLNAFLTATCAGLVCALGACLFDRRTGLLAGVLVACNPLTLLMLSPLTEAAAISLVLLAVWLVVQFGEPPRTWAFVIAGLAVGLGYLARPTVAVAGAALVVGALWTARDRRALVRPLAGLAGGAALFGGPISVYSLLTRGSLSYSGQDYQYRVRNDYDVLHYGYAAPLPSAVEFISSNLDFIASTVLENFRAYAALIALDPSWLLLLLPVWPVIGFALVRGRYPRAARILLVVAAANFVLHALTWATHTVRYQLLVLFLLAPFVVDALVRLGLGRVWLIRPWRVSLLHLYVLGVILFWSPTWVRAYQGRFLDDGQIVATRMTGGYRWTGSPAWVNDPDLPALLEWANARTERDSVLASGEPWIVTHFTRRPATLLPVRLSAERLRQFLVDYRVSYVLLDSSDRPRRQYREYLDALASEGVGRTTVEGYRIYDVRPLWR